MSEPYLRTITEHHAITTSSPEAETWYFRGEANIWGFNHEEAIRCFELAIMCDPNCVAAHWGISYSSGANYNSDGFVLFHQNAFTSLQNALRVVKSTKVSRLEEMLVFALAHRYDEPPSDGSGTTPERLTELNTNFAAAMAKVYREFPNEAFVAVLYADALMNINPWKLWEPDQETGDVHPRTFEIQDIVERGLVAHPDHVGLLHLYVHIMELSATPAKALFAADKLRALATDNGHLIHMASHIDMWVGNFEAALKSNEDGIAADERYARFTGNWNNFYLGYRMHNYHFAVWAAMFDGQYAKAKALSEEMSRQLELHLLSPEDQAMLTKEWEEILAESFPTDTDLYCSLYSTMRYARGIAYAAMGDVDNADIEQAAFLASLNNPELKARRLHNNTMLARRGAPGMLDVAREMLAGEIAYRRAEYSAAFNHLREAVRLDDKLNYDEPWAWMVPARHALGALLLEQGHFAEAESVFRKDLVRYPDNLWALGGLLRCLRSVGLAQDEIATLDVKYKIAAKRFDPSLPTQVPCMCATRLAEKAT
eukprot:c1737_g1_i2.p1 GENE.c1737_g1_i2~~c1737_g1_i2.p1  ORF type:complete len:540 (-),score=134.53 c1737_g1_i2:53-1672(-)